MSLEIAKRFFEGPDGIRQRLKSALTKKRREARRPSLPPEQLDRACALGKNGLPRCADYEEDPSLMTPLLFGVVSFYLDLKVDEVLYPDLTNPEDLKWVLQHMVDHGARLAAAQGADTAGPTAEQAAPMYVILKAMEAIEPAASK